MPGGAAEDVTLCLVLGAASVKAIEKKKKMPTYILRNVSGMLGLLRVSVSCACLD